MKDIHIKIEPYGDDQLSVSLTFTLRDIKMETLGMTIDRYVDGDIDWKGVELAVDQAHDELREKEALMVDTETNLVQ